MSTPILATKLYIPPPRPNVVLRPRLTARLNEGLHRKLTLISAPAGFGKTTLASAWVTSCDRPAAWLSLDAGDNDPTRFLTYLIAALQTIAAQIGARVLGVLHSPQPPPIEAILTALLNDITTVPEPFVLVLDDYHVIDAPPVDHALSFLLTHLPPQLHLVLATREDPQLPLARFRARGQLTELRVADLRFTYKETAAFLNESLGFTLAAPDIAALEDRTEGWIAGLQLAALSMQGQQDTSRFISSFTGSHRFVLEYLVEEVLLQQPDSIQKFLLRTSFLDRLCGPLCDAVLQDPSVSGQTMLDELERANLFIIPLDHERRWYRYHHLFAELLRQRLHQDIVASAGNAGGSVADLHVRASVWYEINGLELEAFQHAAAAGDVERAARLLEGEGMPLLFRGALSPVLKWLHSLPTTVLDTTPSLWIMYASALVFVGQLNRVEQKLQAAEAALEGIDQDDKMRDLVGHIAAIRATLAVTQHEAHTIMAQARRALEYLRPDNLPVRTAMTWALGYAYHLQGDRVAARRAYTEALTISEAIGHFIITISVTIGLGLLEEADNQLRLAMETYRRVLQLAGDPPVPIAAEAHLGLARICYEWNDLAAAEQHAQQSLQLARQLENTDRFIACEVFLARLKIAQGDADHAAMLLGEAGQVAHRHNFMRQIPEVAAAHVRALLRQGNLTAAAQLAQMCEIPITHARVHLAQGDTSKALAVLESWRRRLEAKNWVDERLTTLILQAVVLQTHGDKHKAMQVLRDALAVAAPGGFIRSFVDEGRPMAQLLAEASAQRIMPDYVEMLLTAFEAKEQPREDSSYPRPVLPSQSLIEPLSQRELEVLRLIAQGHSNREISERLFLALSTVKGHTRNIFGKLDVQRRTEAIARARKLGLL